ncbi:MAG: glycosyltransferase family 4 protein [Planctomycetaceae bacterium]|jgi:glycosyltransferase involved in cell wall biosynthesis|nr:glycosyltransferase family 4 protein [Planctomycetaceae bacterium]
MTKEHSRVLVPVSHPLGGIRTYMLYNFRQLYLEGFRFTFLSEAGDAFDSFKNDLSGWGETDFIEFPKSSGIITIMKTIHKTLKNRSFSLIHSQGLKIGTETAAVNFFKHIPHLITLHDVIVPHNQIPGKFKRCKKAAISFFARRAAVIIPVSKDCETNHLQIFPAWKRGSVKVETIFNGVDVERLNSSRINCERGGGSSLREEFGIDSNIVLGGFFGRFMYQKGFDLLLDALMLLDQRGYGDRFRMVVTKDLNGFFNETIQSTLSNPKVARMVHFIDSLSDIVPLLLQVDVTVIPSRWEACPILPMESLVLGVPVIGSDCIGLREVLRGTPSIVHRSDDAESLAAVLIDFIERPTKNAAADYVADAVKRFDVRKATDQLLKIYQSFCVVH